MATESMFFKVDVLVNQGMKAPREKGVLYQGVVCGWMAPN